METNEEYIEKNIFHELDTKNTPQEVTYDLRIDNTAQYFFELSMGRVTKEVFYKCVIRFFSWVLWGIKDTHNANVAIHNRLNELVNTSEHINNYGVKIDN